MPPTFPPARRERHSRGGVGAPATNRGTARRAQKQQPPRLGESENTRHRPGHGPHRTHEDQATSHRPLETRAEVPISRRRRARRQASNRRRAAQLRRKHVQEQAKKWRLGQVDEGHAVGPARSSATAASPSHSQHVDADRQVAAITQQPPPPQQQPLSPAPRDNEYAHHSPQARPLTPEPPAPSFALPVRADFDVLIETERQPEREHRKRARAASTERPPSPAVMHGEEDNRSGSPAAGYDRLSRRYVVEWPCCTSISQ